MNQFKKIELALHKDREKTIDFCKKYSHIFLYGAGRTAVQLIDYLRNEDFQLDGIIVSDGKKVIDTLEEISVVELKEFTYHQGDGIILAVAESIQPEIIAQLKEKFGDDITCHVYHQHIFYSGVETTEDDWYAGTQHEGTYFSNINELELLGEKYGTDKSEKKHNYLHKYEFFLRKWRQEKFVLMELGVFRGQSLAMWEDYFPNAKIIGVDIDEDCRQYQNGNKEIIITDLSKVENLIALKSIEPTVIVDDASHGWRDQIFALMVLFPAVKSGGIFILEDLGTSFSKHLHSAENDAAMRAYDFLALVCEATTGGIQHRVDINSDILAAANNIARDVEMISFIYGACVLVKR